MLGAVIGDVIGSVYEWNNIKTKDFKLFKDGCKFTDDTVMTCAVAEAIMNGGTAKDFRESMRKWGNRYFYAGYGSMFFQWLISNTDESINSYGNGAAMRISPCAEYMYKMSKSDNAEDYKTARGITKTSIIVSHSHYEAIRGGMAIVDTIVNVSKGREAGVVDEKIKRHIKHTIENEYHYDLTKSIDEIRPEYRFTASCQGSVPQAIRSFIDGVDFEDTIRNAISIGGDSDTIAAMAGSIAEAAWGIPNDIREQVFKYLDTNIINTIKEWYAFIGTERLSIV